MESKAIRKFSRTINYTILHIIHHCMYEIFWWICFHWPIRILGFVSLNIISTCKATYFPPESVHKSTTLQILSGPGHRSSNIVVCKNKNKKTNYFYVALWLGKTLQKWSRNPGNDKPSKVSVNNTTFISSFIRFYLNSVCMVRMDSFYDINCL